MSDPVRAQILRDVAAALDDGKPVVGLSACLRRAADEIERLEQVCHEYYEKWGKEIYEHHEYYEKWGKEIYEHMATTVDRDALRAALREALPAIKLAQAHYRQRGLESAHKGWLAVEARARAVLDGGDDAD